MLTASFLKDTAERALKSVAQALIIVLGGNGFDFWSADWKTILGVGLSGGLLSILTSLASGALPAGSPGTASLSKAVEAAPTEPK